MIDVLDNESLINLVSNYNEILIIRMRNFNFHLLYHLKKLKLNLKKNSSSPILPLNQTAILLEKMSINLSHVKPILKSNVVIEIYAFIPWYTNKESVFLIQSIGKKP